MELVLNRSQRETGMMNKKIAFGLHAKVRLNEEEQAALNRYKFTNTVIYHKENVAPDVSGEKIFRNLAAATMNLTLTVEDLTNGRTIECKDIVEMIGVEEEVKSACGNLKNLLEAAKGFEGEDVIKY